MAQPYKDTIEDFNLKWGTTYALYNGEIYYVRGAYYKEVPDGTPAGEPYVILFKNKAQFTIDDFDFNCLVPITVNSMFVNVDKKCLLIYRNPRRQNKRSICADTIYIYNPVEILLPKKTRRFENNCSYQLIEQIVKPFYPKYLDALQLCYEHYMVAISPDFAVSLSNISDTKFLLSSQFGFIGEADQAKLYIYHPGSFQEISDYVNRTKLNVEVTKCQ